MSFLGLARDQVRLENQSTTRRLPARLCEMLLANRPVSRTGGLSSDTPSPSPGPFPHMFLQHWQARIQSRLIARTLFRLSWVDGGKLFRVIRSEVTWREEPSTVSPKAFVAAWLGPSPGAAWPERQCWLLAGACEPLRPDWGQAGEKGGQTGRGSPLSLRAQGLHAKGPQKGLKRASGFRL